MDPGWFLQVSLNYEFFALVTERIWDRKIIFYWINFGSWDLCLNGSNRTNIVGVIVHGKL